ncbi:MAG TPA: DUF423 domain-containing protein [Stellaceae bacterium]|nr:DUF423 domain-containing protein [Stellaceae bacterium]
MMSERFWICLAGLSGAIAVGAEAASRHLLQGDPRRLDFAATGGRYALLHALALLAVALLARRGGGAWRWLAVAGWCFSAGLVLFSGSLYALALGAPMIVAAATPVGGSAFIAGWLALAAAGVFRE